MCLLFSDNARFGLCKPKRSIAQFTLASLLLVVSQEARLQHAAAYWTRGVPGETTDFKIALAQSARPLWYVLDEDTSLDKLLIEKCGDQPVEVATFLRERAAELNAVSTDQVLTPGEAVAIPFCHKVDENFPIRVVSGDTIEGILISQSGLHGSKSVAAVVSANTEMGITPSDNVIKDFAMALREGQRLILPYASMKRLFVPEDELVSPEGLLAKYPAEGFLYTDVASSYEATASSGDVIAEALEIESTTDQRTRLVDSAALHGDRDTAISFVNVVTFDSNSADPNCSETPVLAFDAVRLRKRVYEERAALLAAGRQVRHGVVGIIDSGLWRPGHGLFPDFRFQINYDEVVAGSAPGRTDDANDFVDDLYGINFVSGTGEIRPFPAANPKTIAHGTQVASLILGGPEYLLSEPPPEPMGKLIVVNFGNRPSGIQPPERLMAAVDYLVDRDSDIVNMSLSSAARLTGLKERIERAATRVLFVVAAGNTNPRGQPLNLIPRYPASWGGAPDRPNVVTVGAVDNAGRRARFSNYGHAVDIYAPGCSRRTIDHNEDKVVGFGTSMAAAHVTFISSLLRGLGGTSMHPKRIKNRLVSSADYKHSFQAPENYSNVLNEVKAVSLTHDIVELVASESAPAKLEFGHLPDIDSLRRYCSGTDKNLLKNIRKVTPNIIAADGTKTIRYLAIPAGLLGDITCLQENEDHPIRFVDQHGRTSDLLISDVEDIVLATIRL